VQEESAGKDAADVSAGPGLLELRTGLLRLYMRNPAPAMPQFALASTSERRQQVGVRTWGSCQAIGLLMRMLPCACRDDIDKRGVARIQLRMGARPARGFVLGKPACLRADLPSSPTVLRPRRTYTRSSLCVRLQQLLVGEHLAE